MTTWFLFVCAGSAFDLSARNYTVSAKTGCSPTSYVQTGHYNILTCITISVHWQAILKYTFSGTQKSIAGKTQQQSKYLPYLYNHTLNNLQKINAVSLSN